MIGRTERFVSRAPRPKSDLAPYLALSEFGSIVGHRDINLAVSPGEILGLYGLVGAGRSELAKSIVGLMAQTTGEIRVNGNKVHISSPAKALHDFGIGYMSEDRKHEGLIQQHSVLMNLGITVWQRLANTFGFLRDKTVIKYTNPILQKIEFKTASIYESIGNLSGGNQQKISVAKWIAGDVKLLIIDEPTIGIDIKTKTYIHDLIHELAAGGTAILLITSEMSEMIEVADRVIVMSDFQIRGLVENDRNYQRTSQAIMNLIHRSEPTLARAEYITKQ